MNEFYQNVPFKTQPTLPEANFPMRSGLSSILKLLHRLSVLGYRMAHCRKSHGSHCGMTVALPIVRSKRFILPAIGKEEQMKNLANILLPVALLCLLGAFGVTAIGFFVVVAASFGFERLFYYFQYLKLPFWSVGLPIVGILALLPLALRLAFGSEAVTERRSFADLINTFRRW